jgi:hypothetical protein
LAFWDDVVLSQPGLYQFKANGIQLPSCLSNYIFCGIDNVCLAEEIFESTINPSWVGSSDWYSSTISPITGVKSLQHRVKSNEGISTLSIPIGNNQIAGNKNMEWNFTLRNGTWDPSSDNYFYFVLASDSSNLNIKLSKGFAVGINPNSDNDFLSLGTLIMV